MKKNLLTIILSIAGAVIGVCISEALQINQSVPGFIRTGIYFVIPLFLAVTGAVIAELISPVYARERDRVFTTCVAAATAVTLIGGFGISALMQFLYEISWNGGQNNIVLLLDVSGSMDMDDKKVNEFEAAENIISQLSDKDKAAVIYFKDTDSVRLPMTGMTGANKAKFIAALKEDVNKTGGTTNPDIGIDAAIKMAGDIQGECAVFMISDGQGIIGDDKINQSIKNNVVFYALDVSGFEDADTKALCERTGGQYIVSDNPNAVNDTMQSMYKSHITGNNRLLYRPRSSDTGTPVWYCSLISMLFYALIGGVMSLSYMLLINRKDIGFIYNLAGGIVTGCVMEINSFILGIDLLIAPMLVLLICPAFVRYTGKKVKAKNDIGKTISGDKDENYIPGMIIK